MSQKPSWFHNNGKKSGHWSHKFGHHLDFLNTSLWPALTPIILTSTAMLADKEWRCSSDATMIKLPESNTLCCLKLPSSAPPLSRYWNRNPYQNQKTHPDNCCNALYHWINRKILKYKLHGMWLNFIILQPQGLFFPPNLLIYLIQFIWSSIYPKECWVANNTETKENFPLNQNENKKVKVQ